MIEPQTYQPTILFEDNHILVVLKEQGIASCPDESGDVNLCDLLKAYIKRTYEKPGNVYLGLVHRLDRPTGGVMVFAKTSKAAARLTAQMRTGDFEKRYLAVLGGTLVGSVGNYTGWKAPTDLVELRGPWEIQFVSGQTMKIPNGTIMANLGGKLTLTEVSKIECQLKVNKPEEADTAPYEINDTPSD